MNPRTPAPRRGRHPHRIPAIGVLVALLAGGAVTMFLLGRAVGIALTRF
jgi:hypothetical protein